MIPQGAGAFGVLGGHNFDQTFEECHDLHRKNENKLCKNEMHKLTKLCCNNPGRSRVIQLVMYKASTLITTAGMYTLYCSLFQPHISYCNELWGNTYASNVNCLCIIQRKVVRLICNVDRLAHTNELFKELYILKFPEFVQYKTAILMYHLFHGTLPIHLQNRFSRYSTTRSTRRINTFVMVQARTNIKAMCLSVYGVKLWNSLSNNLRDCNSVTIFKKNLKKYLISIY